MDYEDPDTEKHNRFYYDDGWNQRVDGMDFVIGRGQDYSDGWCDCDQHMKAGYEAGYI